jgi:hypothetical protein
MVGAGKLLTEPSGPRAPSACVWCGAHFDSSAVRRPGRTVCLSCGAATTDPWPDAATLEQAYARYRPASGRFSGAGDALLRRTRGRLAKRIDRLAPAGRVLDVGAGDGTLVEALRRRGREALGLERDSRHEEVEEASISEVGGEWSAVVFWHSLEHLPEPGRDLDRAAGRLGQGGMLFVAVPNTDSIQALAFGDRWLHLDLPRHLIHLPARALTRRVESLGLELTRVSHWRGGQVIFGWLHGLVGLLPGRPDLYDAIRTPEARMHPMPVAQRAFALGAGVLLFLPAALAAAVEVALRRGGTVHVEARRG